MLKNKNRKAQSTVEYAVLIAVVVGALLAMQIFMKRGTMGKLREGTNQIGDQFTPLQTTSKFNTTYNATRDEILTTKGFSESKLTANELQTRIGEEHVKQALDVEKLY